MSEPLVEQKSKAVVWKKVAPRLYRYEPAGTYYLRARIGGEPYRECLNTDRRDVANRNLAQRLFDLRLASGSRAVTPQYFPDALAIVRNKIEADPSLKSRTRRDYFEALDRLGPQGENALPATKLRRLSVREMAPWWQKVCTDLGPQRANHLLMLARRALKFARQAGSLAADPTEELKRVKIPRTRLNLITLEQFRELVADIRAQRKANSARSADSIEFQAYSGLRPAEMKAVLWSHIDEERGVIWVHGGAEGTKNRESRAVPVVPEMSRLLASMRARDPDLGGKVFPYQEPPRDALHNAIKRLNKEAVKTGRPTISRLRIYDLRHLFATTCNAAGVDVPTFAKWLGHRDGGALAMRTYVHPHDEHSRESAAKVRF